MVERIKNFSSISSRTRSHKIPGENITEKFVRARDWKGDNLQGGEQKEGLNIWAGLLK